MLITNNLKGPYLSLTSIIVEIIKIVIIVIKRKGP